MADFYGTVAGYKTYHNARGRSLVIADQDDNEIQAALLVASEWIDARYRSVWISTGTTKVGMRAQIREWPRYAFVDAYGYAVPSDSVPIEVENATYEVALREVNVPGSLSQDYTPPKYKSASVDGAVSVTYNTGVDASDLQVEIPVIDGILAPLLGFEGAGNLSAMSGRVVRA